MKLLELLKLCNSDICVITILFGILLLPYWLYNNVDKKIRLTKYGRNQPQSQDILIYSETIFTSQIDNISVEIHSTFININFIHR